jgi:hypothetical protein
MIIATSCLQHVPQSIVHIEKTAVIISIFGSKFPFVFNSPIIYCLAGFSEQGCRGFALF